MNTLEQWFSKDVARKNKNIYIKVIKNKEVRNLHWYKMYTSVSNKVDNISSDMIRLNDFGCDIAVLYEYVEIPHTGKQLWLRAKKIWEPLL